MRKILAAEFYRCRHSLIFWLLLFASVLAGGFYGAVSVAGSFDDMFVVPLFVFIAAFISLNTGVEHSDNTVRNKLAIGNTKPVIMLSKMVFSVVTGALFSIAFLIPCAIALKVFGILSRMPLRVILLIALGFVLLTVVWAAIFTVVSMMISLKGLAGVINLALIIAIMFASYQVEFALGQPEYIYEEESTSVQMTPEEVKQVHDGTYDGSYYTTDDDEGNILYYKDIFGEETKIPNPQYVKEPLNTILENLDSMSPHGQVNEYATVLENCVDENAMKDDTTGIALINEFPRVKTFPLYSCLDILLLFGIGLILFRRKNIK